MKNRLKSTLIFSGLSLVLLYYLNNIYAEDNSKDIENRIDYFFEKRSDITTRNIDLDCDNLCENESNNISNEDEELLNKVNIRDDNLEEYFLDYLKLYDVIYSKANLKEDIINEDIDKDIKYEGDNIIVDVVRRKDSVFTIDGIKDDDISTEVARYTFIFDANTHELLDFIPESNEEKVLMNSDMKDVIHQEILNRGK